MLSNRRALADPLPGRAGSPRSVKVCLMIGQLGLGGTEKQVVLLARGLRDRGIDTNVLVLFEGGPREGALRSAGVSVVHLGFARFSTARNAPRNAAAFLGLVRRLRRDRPDVLHAFLFHTYIVAAPAARLARVPILVAGRRSLGVFTEGRRLLLLIERLATKATDLLIANAHAVAENTRRQERVPAGKITVVYNGLPEAAFAEFPPAIVETKHPVVLCVANLKSYKGHRHLLDAVAFLHARDRPCTLVLAGEGDERPALEQQAARLGIDVRFLGACVEVGPLLARADVVVLSSLHEGMSNAVMEAMAAGRPIVATGVGGTPELLDGRGVLVPPGDPVALAAAIERLLIDPDYGSRLGAQARCWSRAHLSADRMIDEHIRIYAGLLERRCAG
jgi:glycosyltransferase involved in cell wall biosynthesis